MTTCLIVSDSFKGTLSSLEICRIAEEVGSGVVEQVIILGPVAPSWKKGPYVVRGRGPRADYG